MADKERHRQLKDEWRLKARQDFNDTLPMSTERFSGLFDNLDSVLNVEGCGDDLALTVQYLTSIGVDNIDQVVSWLNDNGGYCDCEVLANVEEQFE